MKLTFREATEDDIPGLVSLLADDELGQTREDTTIPINQRYFNAFQRIEKDQNNELVVVECQGEIAGMLQLTFIHYLTHMGSTRCLIESVRISRQYRGQGLGTKTITWAVDRAKEKQCSLVQLTSDKQRPQALKFYQSLGFQATHEGFKLKL